MSTFRRIVIDIIRQIIKVFKTEGNRISILIRSERRVLIVSIRTEITVM